MVFRMRSISARGANTAAIRPLSAMETRVISRPRALTASRASSKGRRRRRPALRTRPGCVPSSCRAGCRTPPAGGSAARSMASTAGCVIAVWRRSFFGLRHGGGVGRVDENEIGERLAEQRRHDAVGFGERVARRSARRAQSAAACSRTASPGRYRGTRLWARARGRGRCPARAEPSRQRADWPRRP